MVRNTTERYSLYTTDNEYKTPEDLQKYVWDELSERRKRRICARCGFKGTHYIIEVKRHELYALDSRYDVVENSIDEQAHKAGSPICTECGLQIIGKKPRIFKTSSEIYEIVSKRYMRVIHLKNMRLGLQSEPDPVIRGSDAQQQQIRGIEKEIDVLVSLGSNLRNIK